MFIPWFAPANQRINRWKQQTHSHCRINTSSMSSHRTFLICKTWLLGKNLVQFLTLGQIWKSLLPFYPISLMISSPIFILSNIFIESKNTGGICRQNIHLSIENAWKWDIVLDQRRLFWHTKEKFRNKEPSWVFLIFLKCVKIASIGLRLERPQLQHWSLF